MSDEAVLLDALWHQVVSRWADDEVHAAFLRAAQESGRLAAAAVRYRGMAGDRERHEKAEAQLAAITVLALASLESVRTKVPAKRRTGHVAAVVLGLFFVGALLLLAQALHQ